MKAAAIIVAAGRSVRVGDGIPKQFRRVAGLPAIRWSVQAFANAGLNPLVAVIGAGQDRMLADALLGGAQVTSQTGGANRTASVRAGLAALAAEPPEIVLIHDGLGCASRLFGLCLRRSRRDRTPPPPPSPLRTR